PVIRATLPSRRKLSRTAMTLSYCFCGVKLDWLRQLIFLSDTEGSLRRVQSPYSARSTSHRHQR
ncbi:MAG: hypothetical protein WBZ57_10100, partial [Pseudomonas graminis]